MQNFKKIKLAVIFGGMSSEHEVSLASAQSVLQNCDGNDFEVYPVGITREGKWFYYTGHIDEISSGKWEQNTKNIAVAILPDRSRRGLTLFGDNIVTLPLDCVFPVLHGKNGEDGSMQGLLELSGIPYVGCGVTSSALCMDKAFTNIVARAAGLIQPKWLTFTRKEFAEDENNVLSRAEKELEYPMFVKPANTGSSVGINKAKSRAALANAIREALGYDGKFIVEEAIVGREIETAALGNGDVRISCVGEVLPAEEFYTYNSKYNSSVSRTVIPAELTRDESERVRAEAEKVYRALDCQGLARIDFFLRDKDNAVVFNEANTLPGFTSISMYAKLFIAEGMTYNGLIKRLCELAIEKAADKQ